MKIAKGLLAILVFTVLIITSCTDSKPIPDINGEELTSVKGDTVFAKSGKYVVLDSVKKVYYLIRHAEKDSVPKDNPALTPEGIRRATLLADILRATRVDAIYSTFYTRTLFTVDSLADIKAMSILPYEAKNLRTVVDAIQADDNLKAVVVVGHSNTTPSLANTLAGKTVFQKPFDEKDYDNFVIVYEKINGEKEVLSMKYKIKE
jgi:phosphohistidine phosphatase SixA